MSILIQPLLFNGGLGEDEGNYALRNNRPNYFSVPASAAFTIALLGRM